MDESSNPNGEVLVYGTLNGAKYADKFKNNIGQKVNTRTLENGTFFVFKQATYHTSLKLMSCLADTYAWMLTNNYFNKKLGWGDNGNTDLPFEGLPGKRSLVSTRDDGPPTLYPLDEVPGDNTNIVNGDQLPAIALVTIPICQTEATCEYTDDDDIDTPEPTPSDLPASPTPNPTPAV